MISDRQFLYAILRNDLASFIMKCFETVDGGGKFEPNWHLNVIADRLERVQRGELKRLLITMPPRSLKSMCASVAFPAFILGHDPSRRIICASYGQELASKLARDCRSVMQAPWYRAIFPSTTLNPNKMAEDEFETTRKGYRLATSVGGALTGRGGNIIIIDDPIKPQDVLSATVRERSNTWFNSTAYSRLDDKKSDAIVIVMQRLHVDDLAAHVRASGEVWEHLNLPAIAAVDEHFELGNGKVFVRAAGHPLHATREPLSVLDDVRAQLGTYHFSAQYLQEPVPIEGNLFRMKWFQVYDPGQRLGPPAGARIYQSWDTAFTVGDGRDWSVCSTWAVDGRQYYLLNVYREQLNFPELKRKIVAMRQEWKATAVLLEDASTGTALIQQLRSEGSISVISVRPEGSKVERARACSAHIEAGQVLLPREASWLDTFRREVLMFPNGRHDDQVDSMSQFLNWHVSRGSGVTVRTIKF